MRLLRHLHSHCVDFGVAHALLLQQLPQALVLFYDSSRSSLDLCRCFYTHLLAVTVFRLELLEVVLPPCARTALVVSNAREVGTSLERTSAMARIVQYLDHTYLRMGLIVVGVLASILVLRYVRHCLLKCVQCQCVAEKERHARKYDSPVLSRSLCASSGRLHCCISDPRSIEKRNVGPGPEPESGNMVAESSPRAAARKGVGMKKKTRRRCRNLPGGALALIYALAGCWTCCTLPAHPDDVVAICLVPQRAESRLAKFIDGGLDRMTARCRL